MGGWAASRCSVTARLLSTSIAPTTSSRSYHPARSLDFRSILSRRLSTSRPRRTKNQVFASVRNSDTFHTYQLLSSSSRTPLVTLWTTSWCSTCRVVEPLLQSIIEAGVGEAEGGVGYCTVEYDAPDIIAAGMGLTYMINSVPTLLSFDAQEAQIQTKIRDGRLLSDRKFLEEWIRTEARRHGDRGGGAGGGTHSGFFGGLLKS